MGNRDQAIHFLKSGEETARNKTDQKLIDHAYQLMASACYADPTYWDAFYRNGNAAVDLQRPEAAIACYRRALECAITAHEKAPLLTNLAWKLHERGEFDEAIKLCNEAIDLNPKLNLPWIHLSSINTTLGATATAVQCAYKAVELSPPDDALAEFALSFALLFDRQYAKGFKAFEARFAHRLPQFLHYPYPKWKGEKGKTVFLVADQGLGDTLSFARFIPQVAERAGYVHACVQQELMRTFRYAFRKYDNINWLPQPCNFPAADAWTTFVSLPYALGLTDQQIRDVPNYETLRENIRSDWKVPDRKLHIGIAWAGSPQNDIDKHRCVPVTQFLELYRVPGIQLYSLQMDQRKHELFSTGCAPLIRDLSGYARDITDSFNLLRHLDMVISIESALPHICSMIDKECWVPYSALGKDYRVGPDGTDRLWTPHHRVFCQQLGEAGWGPTFNRIIEALQEKLHESELRVCSAPSADNRKQRAKSA